MRIMDVRTFFLVHRAFVSNYFEQDDNYIPN
jgi:hypothetical protein